MSVALRRLAEPVQVYSLKVDPLSYMIRRGKGSTDEELSGVRTLSMLTGIMVLGRRDSSSTSQEIERHSEASATGA